MEEVYENRLHWNQVQPCDECVGMVAMLDCERIGDKVWLRYDDRVSGPFLTIDCADKKDLPEIGRRRIVVELSYEIWHELGFPERPVPMTVLASDIK